MEEAFEMDLTCIYINYLLVGEANLGPKVLGVFKGGIITEFFEVFQNNKSFDKSCNNMFLNFCREEI